MPLTRAHEFTEKATEYVGGDRARTHGDKGANFKATAIMWTAYLRMKGHDIEITGEDFAHMMVLAKMSRTHTGEYNEDDYVDMAGYSGCAGEVAAQFHDVGVGETVVIDTTDSASFKFSYEIWKTSPEGERANWYITSGLTKEEWGAEASFKAEYDRRMREAYEEYLNA